MTAEIFEHQMEELRRGGNSKAANMIQTGQDARFKEQVDQFLAENPDAPSIDDYNYRLMFEKGKMPTPTDDGSLAFLPNEGWINRRGGGWTPGLGGVPLTTSSYDVNSKSWQSQNWVVRTAKHAANRVYQNVLGQVTAPMASAMAPLYEDRDAAVADIQQAMTPDVLEHAQINESDTWGGAGEQMASVLFEIGSYIGLGKASLAKGAAKNAMKRDSISMGKTRDFMQGFAKRLEEATDPGVVFGEFMYAIDPSNSETMSGGVGDWLEQMGYEGPITELLQSSDDDKYARVVTNIIEGAMFFEVLRTAGRLGLKIPSSTLKAGQKFVTAKYDAAVKELDVLQRALPMSIGEFGFRQEGRISTRLPTAKKATENPFENELKVGLESARADPKMFEHNVNLMREYDNFGDLPENTDEAAEQIISHGVSNLLRLYDTIPDAIRTRSKQWYVGANKIADNASTRFGVSKQSAAAVYAALSPQKDWLMNVSLGDRVMDIWTNRRNAQWDDVMDSTLDRLGVRIKSRKGMQAINSIRGKTLAELEDPIDRALWIRIFDEGNNPRSYNSVSPEGDIGDVVKTAKGDEAKAAWGSLSAIANAVDSLDNPDLDNISKRMGEQHKVRNFYNNIIAPMSSGGDVTIDTHAVAAALFSPFSGKNLEVKHNFGGSDKGIRGPVNSAVTGDKGTYGIYAEMYRRAAQERGVLPREMQSITWEGVRGLFPKEIKQKEFKRKISEVWADHANGKITLEEAQDQIIDLAGGIDDPAWH